MKNKVKRNIKREKEKTERKTVKKAKKKVDISEDKVVYAKGKYLKTSAHKARLVINLIRGKNALDMVQRLDFINKKASLLIKKVLDSAISNAVINFDMDKKKLIITEAYINEAPTFKRSRAGSRGRNKKILKRNAHVTIGLKES